MSTAEDRTFESIEVGEVCAREHTIGTSAISSFANLSGDYNPLHTDPVYAETTAFKKPVVHGMYLGALVSELVGMHLPGARCLLVKETLEFKLPVYTGDTISISVTVVHKSDVAHLLELSIKITRGNDVVAEGAVYTKVL